jgi:hypothetical protein
MSYPLAHNTGIENLIYVFPGYETVWPHLQEKSINVFVLLEYENYVEK